MIEICNRVIDTPVEQILYDVKRELTNDKLAEIRIGSKDIQVTCPIHAEGHERRPSCFIRKEDGVFHCFTCGSSGGLDYFIAHCFGCSVEHAQKWLITKYANDFVTKQLELAPIVLDKEQDEQVELTLDESILDTFEDYHPYMTQRKITDEVREKFKIKYDKATQMIVFPVRDINGKLVALTKRSVNTKRFDIPKGFNKKNIFLLDACKNEREVVVVESQINALTLWGWGRPAICLFGAGTTWEQINELNKTNIKHFILAYDPDEAGVKGASRFKKYINKRCFVDELHLPVGKDVNDLTKEEFDKIYEESI